MKVGVQLVSKRLFSYTNGSGQIGHNMKDSKWADINRAGSGTPADASDRALNPDTERAVNNANRASELHQQANELAERGLRK